MMTDPAITALDGTIRRAQAYANIYEHVGFKPFYLSDFNDMVDYSHQISSSMLTSLRLSQLVRKTGNKREYDIYLGEWNGVKHIKRAFSYEWQLEFDSASANELQAQIRSIILELVKLYKPIADAHVEAYNMTH